MATWDPVTAAASAVTVKPKNMSFAEKHIQNGKEEVMPTGKLIFDYHNAMVFPKETKDRIEILLVWFVSNSQITQARTEVHLVSSNDSQFDRKHLKQFALVHKFDNIWSLNGEKRYERVVFLQTWSNPNAFVILQYFPHEEAEDAHQEYNNYLDKCRNKWCDYVFLLDVLNRIQHLFGTF